MGSGLRQFQDTLALEAVMERWMLDGTPEGAPGRPGSPMDALLASFPGMSLAPAQTRLAHASTCCDSRGVPVHAWVPPQIAEVLRIMAPLTVTVQPDNPLFSSSLELDMRLFCRV